MRVLTVPSHRSLSGSSPVVRRRVEAIILLPGRSTSHRPPAFSINRSGAQYPTLVLFVPLTLVWLSGPGPCDA